MIVRELRPDVRADTEGFSEVRRLALPFVPSTPEEVVHTDGKGRYATAMTGTARAFRGRGLAKPAKNHSLHRARAAGFMEAFTGNDTGNGPMLTINKWFGYRICATEVRHVRELG